MPLVRFNSHFFPFRFSSSCFAFNMCFNRHIARAHTGEVIEEWKLQMTNELIHGWFVTFFGIVDSNVIKYNMRCGGARWYTIQKKIQQKKKNMRPHRECGDDDDGQIYLFVLVLLFHTLWRGRRAGERKRDVWLLTNIYGPVFGHIQRNWLVTIRTIHCAFVCVFFFYEDLDKTLGRTVIAAEWMKK